MCNWYTPLCKFHNRLCQLSSLPHIIEQSTLHCLSGICHNIPSFLHHTIIPQVVTDTSALDIGQMPNWNKYDLCYFNTRHPIVLEDQEQC